MQKTERLISPDTLYSKLRALRNNNSGGVLASHPPKKPHPTRLYSKHDPYSRCFMQFKIRAKTPHIVYDCRTTTQHLGTLAVDWVPWDCTMRNCVQLSKPRAVAVHRPSTEHLPPGLSSDDFSWNAACEHSRCTGSLWWPTL